MRAALGFLTVVGGHAAPDRRAPAWFAPVGALVGAAVGAVWWAAAELWPPALAAVLAVAGTAALTGMLHLDGLADAADGLLPPLPRARRLDVMATPDVGAFGVVAVALVLATEVLAFAALAPDVPLVVGVMAASRGAMALTLATVRYARGPGGLAAAFGAGEADGAGTTAIAPARRSVPVAAAVGLAGGLAVVVAARGWPGLAVAAGLVAGFAAVVGVAVRRLGGYTGDVLGAAGVVGEAVALLVAAARW
jgi:adenosylcobinamide-GDP ribazoletransferase